jgi:phosphate transport system permease protein
METTTVFLVLVLLTVISFFMGRKRSHAVVSGRGGARALHSLPKHYGYMAALWALLPSVLVLVLWLVFEHGILAHLVVSQLPSSVGQMSASEQGLYFNQIVSFASGGTDASQLDPAQVIAADHYRALVASSRTVKALLVFLVALRYPLPISFSDWSGARRWPFAPTRLPLQVPLASCRFWSAPC